MITTPSLCVFPLREHTLEISEGLGQEWGASVLKSCTPERIAAVSSGYGVLQGTGRLPTPDCSSPRKGGRSEVRFPQDSLVVCCSSHLDPSLHGVKS
jgi:hypothetical protein